MIIAFISLFDQGITILQLILEYWRPKQNDCTKYRTFTTLGSFKTGLCRRNTLKLKNTTNAIET